MASERTSHSRFEISESRRLTFYAAVFDTEARVLDYMPHRKERDYYTEVIRPGSFKRTLRTEKEIIANIDHNPTLTFAKKSDQSLILQEDPKGLFASAWIPENELGDTIIAGVKNESLTGCSFRFDIVNASWVGQRCELYDVNLEDVCVTNNPAYPNTEVRLRTQSLVQQYLTRLAYIKIKRARNAKQTGDK